MAWRETFLRCFGPGILGGITFGDWVRLLRENRFDIAPTRLLRAISITCQSSQNSLFRWHEQRRMAAQRHDVEVLPPLFVLGHWRSGTTLLHNLLTVDQRFAFSNNYQALFPHTFLTMEALHSAFIEWFLPPRRPMDNVEWTMRSPQEDEFALCITTFKSPCMAWFFPQRREYYDRYLTLRDVSSRMHCLQRPCYTELDEWILRQYRIMYQAFFEERSLIPAGHYHEVAYEELERDPVGEVQRIYQALGLPDFGETQPAVESFVRSFDGYQKNHFPKSNAELRQRIADEWRFCFEHWGYPLDAYADV